MSYTWGDPLTVFDTESQVSCRKDWAAPAFEILCDGKPVSVSTNLYTMLLALRRISSNPETAVNDIRFTQRFWIDALCINQSDIDEKSQQIMMMSRIYKRATCVFIWLGGEDYETGRVVQHLANLANLANLDEGRMPLLNEFILDVDMYKELGIPPISVDDWVEIYKFCNRAWFSRAWIVQEVGLAKQTVVICGLYLFRGTAIRSSLEILKSAGCIDEMRNLVEPLIYGGRNKYQRSESRFRADLTNRRIFQPSVPNTPFDPNLFSLMLEEGFAVGGTEHWMEVKTGIRPKPLWRILNRFGGLQATDPRDKVYAFMGLSRELFEEGRQLVPKYSQPVEEVYFEAVRFMAGSVSGLNFLGIKEADSSLELPSWIPEFSALNSEISLMVAYNIRSSASDSLDPRSFHIDKKKLSVLGVFCGKVLRNEPFSLFHLGTIMELLEGIPETSDIWKPPVGTGWEVGDVDDVPGIHKTAKRGWTLTHQRRYETLWRTLVSDSCDGEQPAPMTCEKSMDLMIQSFVTRHLLGATMSLARNQEELDFLLGRFKPSKLEIHKSLDG
uniref:Heterokaryon incompatibility domain-containing protein n=1 Tax=Bionectria ochroleuca TaxID=29856 RepID=A0A8H7NC92_BIOOC